MTFSILISDTEFYEPKPSILNVRKIVVPLSSGDTKDINHVLSAVNNMMKVYRPENTEFVIIAYGQGLKALLKDFDKSIRTRIEALMAYDVAFIGCINTMNTLNISKKRLLDNTTYVTAGLVEIVERQLKGYTYIYP